MAALMAMGIVVGVVARPTSRSRWKAVVGPNARDGAGQRLEDVCLQHLQRCMLSWRGVSEYVHERAGVEACKAVVWGPAAPAKRPVLTRSFSKAVSAFQESLMPLRLV